ncbi:MAG: BRO family protein [Pseudomonadota bacterium]
MSGLQVFAFGHVKVRTAGTFEVPLFCAADVCAVLEIDDVARACERLDQDEVAEVPQKLHNPSSRGTGRPALYVTESGLFSLILGSRKPEAKAFKKWVTSEVLPEIRKRGYYDALEVERRKTTAQLLEACFPNAPTKAKPLFSDLISALLEMRNEERTGNPPWAPVLAQLVYGWAIPVEGQQEKRRELNGARAANKPDHSMFSDELRSHVLNVARVGIALAKNSMSWIEWRARMDTAFHGAPMQLTFLSPTRLPPKPRGRK